MEWLSKNKTPVLLLLLSLFTYFLQFSLNVFLARHLGKALYGDFSVGLRVLSFISAVLLLGANSQSKKLNAQVEHEQQTEPHAYLRWNFFFLKQSAIVGLVVFLIFSAILFALHFLKIQPILDQHYVVYFLWASPLAAIVTLIAGFYSSTRNYVLADLMSNTLKYFLMLLLFCSTILFIQPEIQTIHIVTIIFLVFLLLLFIELEVMKTILPDLFDSLKSSLKTKGSEIKTDWKNVSMRLLGNSIIFQAILLMDLLIVEIAGQNEESVGLYAAVLTIGSVVWLFGTSINSMLTPRVAPLLAENNSSELQIIYKKVSRIRIGVLIITSVLVIIFSKNLLGFFGTGYLPAELPLYVVILSACIGSFGSGSAALLAFSGHEKTLFNLSLVELAILVIFGVLGTYYFGLLGIACASALATLFKLSACTIIAKDRVGINPLSF